LKCVFKIYLFKRFIGQSAIYREFLITIFKYVNNSVFNCVDWLAAASRRRTADH